MTDDDDDEYSFYCLSTGLAYNVDSFASQDPLHLQQGTSFIYNIM